MGIKWKHGKLSEWLVVSNIVELRISQDREINNHSGYRRWLLTCSYAGIRGYLLNQGYNVDIDSVKEQAIRIVMEKLSLMKDEIGRALEALGKC